MRNSNRKTRAAGKGVPDELVIPILSLLPTKSLIRFRCASRSWDRFISDLSSRRRLLLPATGIYFYQEPLGRHWSRESLDYAPIAITAELQPHQNHQRDCLQLFSTVILINSCNGLLLFKNPSQRYSVCNPTMMELFDLPMRRVVAKSSRCYLAYDPRVSPHYKVILFDFQGQIMNTPIGHIYCSMSSCWIEFTVGSPKPPEPPFFGKDSLFRKGSFYMIESYHCKYLIMFDVEKKCFGTIPLPEETTEDYPKMRLGESRGQLYFIKIMWGLKIWMLDEGNGNGKGWLLKHRIETFCISSHPVNRDVVSDYLEVLAFDQDSEVVYLGTVEKVLAYHPSCQGMEEIHRRSYQLGVSLMLGSSMPSLALSP